VPYPPLETADHAKVAAHRDCGVEAWRCAHNLSAAFGKRSVAEHPDTATTAEIAKPDRVLLSDTPCGHEAGSWRH